MVRKLAEVLTSPDDGTAAFRADSVQVLVDPESTVELVDVVRRAGDRARDTMLFFYAGNGVRHERLVKSGALKTVAEAVSAGVAARAVVILDGANEHWFTRLAPDSFVLAGSSFGSGDQLEGFADNLVAGLECGVCDGPDALDLLTLRDVVEAQFACRRYFVEADWVTGPASLTVHCPENYRPVALGVNRSTGNSGMYRDSAAVNDALGW